MIRASLHTVVLLGLTISGTPCGAQDAAAQQAAEQAAQSIISALGQQNYKLVWDQKTSGWFKQHVTSDAFLSNMAMSRGQLGTLQSTSLVTQEHATSDPSTGYQGDIYAFTFRDKYSAAEVYDRIVVIKDSDGQYKLSGIFAAPVPK
jgi:hypothetical protein